VSGHIRRFEEFVGMTLFHRTGRSATLNGAGQAMRPLAEEVVEIVQRMRTRAAPGQLRGSLRVGTITSLHNTLLARAMIAFRRAHPLVTIRLVRKDGHMLHQVERGEFDIAATLRPPQPLQRTLRWHPLLRKPYVLIAPARLAVRSWRAAIRSHPLLRYDESSSAGKDIGDFIARKGVAIKESIWINYADTMISLVAQGLGVAIIPRTPLGDAKGKVKVYSLGPQPLYREIGVLSRAAPAADGIVDAFVATLTEEVVREAYAEAIPAPPRGDS
jgi:DNA-binding transcriptional LysR family regulator